MKKVTGKLVAAVLAVLFLVGCGTDTIYIQSGGSLTMPEPTSTAAPTTVPEGTTTTPTEAPEETTAEPTQTQVETTTADPEEEMVWIPVKGGERYHKTATCSGMQNPQQISRADAESRGYSPCKRCFK